MTFDNAQAVRLAEQLLIRQDAAWTLAEARNLVFWALPNLESAPNQRLLRAAVTATHQIGRVLEHRPGLTRACKWPIDTVRSSVLELLRASNACGDVELLAEALSQVLKNHEPTSKPVVDWVERINRTVREIGAAATVAEFEAKLALSRRLEELTERRREELVTFVESESQLDRRDVAATIIEAARRPAPARESSSRDGSGDARPQPNEIAELVAMVVPTRQSEFVEWLVALAPLAQRAIHRRLSQLAIEPLVHSLWVKPIIDPRCPGLRELRVISEDVHYRILFHGLPAESPRVVGFGFRRDLDWMIRACPPPA